MFFFIANIQTGFQVQYIYLKMITSASVNINIGAVYVHESEVDCLIHTGVIYIVDIRSKQTH